RHCRDIAGRELGKRLRILESCRCRKCLRFQWFIGAKWFTAPAQDEIANWTSLKVFGAIGDDGADANAGAQKLVGSLKPRCRIDGIAVRGVVEKAAATKIADQHGTGMHTDAGDAKIHALSFPLLSKPGGPGVELMRAGDCARCVVRLVSRGV